MTDVAINEETGLPELPEGMWWKVDVNATYRKTDWYATKVGSINTSLIPAVSVSIVTTSTMPCKEWVKVKKHWWSKPVNEFLPNGKYNSVPVHSEFVRDKNNIVLLPSAVRKEEILRTAINVRKNYDSQLIVKKERRREIARLNALHGEYPPNSLKD